MRNTFRLAAATLGGLLLAAAPAVSATRSIAYDTALTRIYGSPGPYTGTLKLTISAAGIVRGYYFPSDGTAMYLPVAGGKTGHSIWFDIGEHDAYRVSGRIGGGTIAGTAIAPGNRQYTFVGRAER